jgi:serine protease Do
VSTRSTNHFSKRLTLAGIAFAGTIAFAPAIDFLDELPSRHRLNGSVTTEAFGEAGVDAARSTLVLILEGKDVALATAIDAEGYLVTKASEIASEGELIALTYDDDQLPVQKVAVDPSIDLALLKVEAGKAQPVRWGDPDTLEQGIWIAAMGASAERLNIGVISATRRSIERRPGVLGIEMDQNDDPEELGVALLGFGPNSPAQRIGLEVGDLIVQFEDISIKSRKELGEEIKKYDPLDNVRVKVLRGEEGIPFVVTLNYRSNVFDMLDRNQRMSGKTSKRKAGFSDVLQHELPLSPTAMGGPLVDLTGDTVGINIARADRVTTFALPATLVKEVAEKLKTGAAERDK